MSKSFASIQNHRKVFAVQRRQVNQLNCPLSKCCWRWQHQKLHIAVLQLLEAPAEMTRCTTAALCPRRNSAWVKPDRMSIRSGHPTLIQPCSKSQHCKRAPPAPPPSPPPPNLKHDNNKSLAENLLAGEKHSCTWAASARKRFAQAQCNVGRGYFCRKPNTTTSI